MIVQLYTLLVSLFLFTGFGLPAAVLLRRNGMASMLLTPSLGVGALTLFVTWLYIAGLSATAIGGAAACLSVGFIALFRGTLSAALARIVARERLATAILAGCCLVLIAPLLTGRADVTITRGNPWDNFSYLKMSAVFAMRRYSEISASTAADAAANPLLLNPGGLLSARPAVNFLHAAIARLVPGSLAGGGYPLLCALMIAGMLAFAGLLRLNFGRPDVPRAAATILLAGAYALGFWGQYPADIDAWSAVAATPVFLAAWALALRVLSMPPQGGLGAAMAVMALPMAGALYLYPEGTLYHGVILGALVLVRGMPGLRRPGRPRLVIAGATVIAIGAAVPFWHGTIGFLAGQAQIAATERVPWWQYFDAYLFGQDPDANKTMMDAAAALAARPDLWPAVPTAPLAWLTGVAGTLGVYFLTPAAIRRWSLEDTARTILLIAVFAGTALGLVRSWRSRLPAYRLLLAAAAIGLLGAVLLAERGQAWAAGKALSYSAPLLCLALGAPALLADRTVTSTRLAPLPWVLAQAWFAVLALIGLGNAHGVRLPAPYPDWQSEDIKGDGRWEIAAQMARLRPCASVRVVALDPFFRDYAAVVLFEAGKPFSYDDRDDEAPLPRRCRLIQAGLPDFMPRTGPPSGVMAFPIGLMVPNLYFTGVWQDGWLRAHANLRLTLPGKSELLNLSGEIPRFSAQIAGGTMRISVDGAVVLERPQSAGRFTLSVPIPRAAGIRDIKLDMTGVYALPEDGRPVAMRLDSIALDSGPGLDQDPAQ